LNLLVSQAKLYLAYFFLRIRAYMVRSRLMT